MDFLVTDHFAKTSMNVYLKIPAMKMQSATIPLEVIHAIARKDSKEMGLDQMDALVRENQNMFLSRIFLTAFFVKICNFLS